MISASNEYNLLNPDCHGWWISKMQSGHEDTLEERYAITFGFKLGKMPQKRTKYLRLLLDHLAWIEHQFLSGMRDSRKPGSLWGMIRGVGGVKESIHTSWLARGLGLGFGLLCWGFKGVQEVGQWHFHRDNAPVHNSILVTDYLAKNCIKTVPHRPYSPDLSPCELRGCRYETIEEMKEAVTMVIDTLTQEDFHGGLPEVVGTVQQVHCRRRRLLRRGLEFHVFTINKSAHTKKSGNLFNDPRIHPNFLS